jgi:hypothetical protein
MDKRGIPVNRVIFMLVFSNQSDEIVAIELPTSTFKEVSSKVICINNFVIVLVNPK